MKVTQKKIVVGRQPQKTVQIEELPTNTKTTNANIQNKHSNKLRVSALDKVIPFKQEYFGKMNPVSMNYLERIALEWYEIAKKDEGMLRKEEYFIAKEIHMNTFDTWKERCPELKEAEQNVLLVLGIRREKGVINRKYEPSFITRTQSHYDSVFKGIEEWRANLAAKVTGAGGNVIVEMHEFERKNDKDGKK